jgi:phosphohistidine phosphatase SixA
MRTIIALLLLAFATPAAEAALFAPDGAGGPGGDPCSLVVAVRHAEKDLTPGTPDPGLTEAGQARARALSDALAGAHVGAVVVSPTRRARDTAAPIAERSKVAPHAVPLEGGLETHVAALVKAVRAEAGKTVLVVGHSNTVPALLRALGVDAGGDLAENAYGDLFLVTLCETGPPRLVRATFGSPASTERASSRPNPSRAATPRSAPSEATRAGRPGTPAPPGSTG